MKARVLFAGILICILLMSACSAASSSKQSASFDYARAADNQAARWIAMGQFYRDHGLLTRAEPSLIPVTGGDKALTSYSADEALDYRWLALARYYQDRGQLTRAQSEGKSSK